MSKESGESARRVYVSFVAESKVVSVTLSWADAQEQGLLEGVGYGLVEGGDVVPRVVGKGPTCPHCGFTQRDFERLGRLGCPRCHEFFAPLLSPLLRRMHRGVVHLGKVPGGALTQDSLAAREAYLVAQLEAAVRYERFEDAAEIRDHLQALRARGQGGVE